MYSRPLRFLAVIFVAMVLGQSLPAAEPQVDEPARRAKLLAPFFDEDSWAVIRVDVEKLDMPSVYALAGHVPDFLQDFPLLPPEQEGLRLAKAFRAAGGKDFYIFLSTKDTGAAPPFVIVPLAPGADLAALKDLISPKDSEATESLGDVLFCDTLARLIMLNPSDRPELQPALAAVTDSAVQVILVPTQAQRGELEQRFLPLIAGDANARPLIREASWLAIGFSAPPRASLKLAIGAADAQAAERIKSGVTGLLISQAVRPEVRDRWPQFGEIQKFLAWKYEDHVLSISLDDSQGQLSRFAQIAVLPPLTTGPFDKGLEITVNQIKQLELALLNHHDVIKSFPPPAITSKDGKPLLSWRVKILPFLEENQMYGEFHLDEPWDSPHNKQFIARMPDVFRCVKSKVGDKGYTVYQVPRGERTIFPGPEGISIRKVIDGVSRTISIVEVDDEHAIPWTKPDDWTFDPENPTAGLGGHFPGIFIAGFADAHVSAIEITVDKGLLRAAFTRDGNEAADLNSK